MNCLNFLFLQGRRPFPFPGATSQGLQGWSWDMKSHGHTGERHAHSGWGDLLWSTRRLPGADRGLCLRVGLNSGHFHCGLISLRCLALCHPHERWAVCAQPCPLSFSSVTRAGFQKLRSGLSLSVVSPALEDSRSSASPAQPLLLQPDLSAHPPTCQSCPTSGSLPFHRPGALMTPSSLEVLSLKT